MPRKKSIAATAAEPQRKPGYPEISFSLSLTACTVPKPDNQSKPKRGRPARRAVVPNSTSDISGDDEDLESALLAKQTPSARKLKAVVIPADHTGKKSGNSTTTPSTMSTRSVSRDFSIDYDTPGTSVAPTPAEHSLLRGGRNRKSALAFRANDKTASASASVAGSKRKRDEPALKFDYSGDESLAKALQQEEYGESPAPAASRRGRRSQAQTFKDEDEDMSDLSSLSDDESDFHTDDSEDLVPAKKRSRVRIEVAAPVKTTRRGRAGPPPPPIKDESEDDVLDGLASLDEESLDDELDFMLGTDTEDSAADQDVLGLATTSAWRRAKPAQRSRRGRGYRMTRAERERYKLETAHPEIVTLWDDLKAIPTITPQPEKQPEGISRQLKSFQLEGLDWMKKQEKTKWKGGLLGDEMGMGKTIQAVSLIMSDYPAKNPTLVIVPPVALVQWSTEVESYTDGKLKVLIHHNSDPQIKKMKAKDLKKYDVIMISYSGLETIYRKQSKGWKRDGGLVKENSRVHAVHYHRLILDEAHSIKSRTASVAKACFALNADYKWCLSGTPVQNRIGEFFSLLRFLEVAPFASYFCKSCPCAQLHWSQNEQKRCLHCNHLGLQHVSIFNQELLLPITQAGDPEERKVAMGKLRLLTDRIMLRRMKRDYTAAMELPPKEVVIHNEFFGEIERDFSQSIMSNTTRQFDTYVSRGVMLNNYANIFGLIMQMRQVANHPDLILKKSAEGGQNVLVCCICDETAEEPIRSKCHHEFCRRCAKDYVRSLREGAAEPDCPRCHLPLAIDFDQPDIEQDEDRVKKNSIINRIKMEDWTSSTKIEMLIYDLYKLRSAKQTHKSIVFSQFTSMLQLVEWRLRRAGFTTVMLDGSMSPAQRAKSIEYFMNNVDAEVFLVSLKAGGVALNLTEASRVFIIDPYITTSLLPPDPFNVWSSCTDVRADGGTPPPSGSRPTAATASASSGRASSRGCALRTRSSRAWCCCRRRRPTSFRRPSTTTRSPWRSSRPRTCSSSFAAADRKACGERRTVLWIRRSLVFQALQASRATHRRHVSGGPLLWAIPAGLRHVYTELSVLHALLCYTMLLARQRLCSCSPDLQWVWPQLKAMAKIDPKLEATANTGSNHGSASSHSNRCL